MTIPILNSTLYSDIKTLDRRISAIERSLYIPIYTTSDSLPTTAGNGQEIYYLADDANGVIWRFRWNENSFSTYKWEFVGGSSLLNEVITSADETTTSATYTTLTTPGPSITLPLAGDYDIHTEACCANSAVGVSAWMSYQVGVTTASDLDAVGFISASVSDVPARLTRLTRRTISSANQTLSARYKCLGGGTAHWYGAINTPASGRLISAIPIRVG